MVMSFDTIRCNQPNFLTLSPFRTMTSEHIYSICLRIATSVFTKHAWMLRQFLNKNRHFSK